MGPGYRLGALDILLYTSVPVMLLLIIPMFLNNEISKLTAFVSAHDVQTALLYILGGQALAVFYSESTHKSVQTREGESMRGTNKMVGQSILMDCFAL